MEKQPKEKKPRATNSWVSFVKEYALKKGITYSCALSDPKCKEAYKNRGVIVQEPVMTAKPVVVKKSSTIKKIEPIEAKKPIIEKPMKLSKSTKFDYLNKKEEQDILNPPYFPEYKGKRYEGKRTSLRYVSVDESNEKAPLRKRIHVSALPKDLKSREEILFFTNSDTEEDIKKDIKTFDILPFNELPITETTFGHRASVFETWNMPKISLGAKRG